MNDPQKFAEITGTSEEESDITLAGNVVFSSITVGGADWTTETVLSQLRKGNIELNPKFQRRDAWELDRKSRFIESLILGLPVPQIVLAERMDARGKYIVLDGKQRLLCLLQFTSNKGASDFPVFSLRNLDIRKDLNGRTYYDLREDLTCTDVIAAFDNQPIRTVIIKNWKDEALLFHVFIRLNMGSKPLSPQELRQALHPGPFVDFADENSTACTAIKRILHSTKPDFRMRDVELVIRHIAFNLFLNRYNGNMKLFLDSTCKELNANWASYEPRCMELMSRLDRNDEMIRKVFADSDSEYNYGKWTGEKFEQRFNRAIFDVLLAYIDNPVVYKAWIDTPGIVVTAYKNLCTNDTRFMESIESTTKSLENTRYRFQAWAASLSKVVGVSITPVVVGK